MSKVYISFLGTNDYLECIYNTGSEENYPPVRFVQETTLSLFAKTAGKEDRAYIFLTDEAREKNWEDDGQWDRDNSCPKKCKGLRSCIGLMNLPFHVEGVRIPEGHDEKQIWEIFDIVYNVLAHSDEVVFDITHAFRSIPMLAIIILNYSKVLKNIQLQRIHYGAFEALGPAYRVKEIPLDQRVAPLIDLTPLVTLSDWTTAVDRFIGAGDAKGVSDLAHKAALPVMSKSKGTDAAAKAVKGIADALSFFSQQLSTCRGPEIVRAANFVKSELSKNQSVDFVRPLVPLLKHVEQQISQFNGNRSWDGVQASKWCLDHGLVQQGFTILKETLISFFIGKRGKDELDKNQREIVSDLATVIQQGKPESDWKGCIASPDNQPDVIFYLSIFQRHKDIIDKWQELTDCRNDMNHAGYRKDALSHKKFEGKLKNLICLAETSVDGC